MDQVTRILFYISIIACAILPCIVVLWSQFNGGCREITISSTPVTLWHTDELSRLKDKRWQESKSNMNGRVCFRLRVNHGSTEPWREEAVCALIIPPDRSAQSWIQDGGDDPSSQHRKIGSGVQCWLSRMTVIRPEVSWEWQDIRWKSSCWECPSFWTGSSNTSL